MDLVQWILPHEAGPVSAALDPADPKAAEVDGVVLRLVDDELPVPLALRITPAHPIPALDGDGRLRVVLGGTAAPAFQQTDVVALATFAELVSVLSRFARGLRFELSRAVIHREERALAFRWTYQGPPTEGRGALILLRAAAEIAAAARGFAPERFEVGLGSGPDWIALDGRFLQGGS